RDARRRPATSARPALRPDAPRPWRERPDAAKPETPRTPLPGRAAACPGRRESRISSDCRRAFPVRWRHSRGPAVSFPLFQPPLAPFAFALAERDADLRRRLPAAPLLGVSAAGVFCPSALAAFL